MATRTRSTDPAHDATQPRYCVCRACLRADAREARSLSYGALVAGLVRGARVTVTPETDEEEE